MADQVNSNNTSIGGTDCNTGSDLEADPVFHFLLMGLFTTLVSFGGIVGNSVSAIVLSRPKMKSSLNCLLLGLTFCDMLVIISTLIVFSIVTMLDFFNVGSGFAQFSTVLSPYFYAVGMTAQTGSVYFTVAVTVERFIAVCHPLRARSLCTWSRAKYYTIIVLLFSVIYNSPRWLELYTAKDDTGRDILLMTPLRCDAVYIKVYVQWANFAIMSFLPIVSLVLLNIIIYAEIHRANSRRQELSKGESREISLAMMLLMVVAVFLICNVLPFVNNFMESMALDMNMNLIDISNFLVNVNSSINCFIYCVFGAKFRKECYHVIANVLPCFKAPGRNITGQDTLHTTIGANTIRRVVGTPIGQSHRNRNSCTAYVNLKVSPPKDMPASQPTRV